MIRVCDVVWVYRFEMLCETSKVTCICFSCLIAVVSQSEFLSDSFK